MFWNTLGVAHYYAGHWEKSIEALTRSMQVSQGALESFDTFFLAMAHWQKGEGPAVVRPCHGVDGKEQVPGGAGRAPNVHHNRVRSRGESPHGSS
jgi:hypothetical protein